jgi:hypothetical protein
MEIPPILGVIPPTGGEGHGLGSHLAAPLYIGNSSFLPLSPYLNDFCLIFLLLFFPLDTALLFDVKAAIMGWLLLAVQLYSTDMFCSAICRPATLPLIMPNGSESHHTLCLSPGTAHLRCDSGKERCNVRGQLFIL